MPRCKKKIRNSKQDNLTTRLIQISLKMDDHIYNNKLISVTAAKEYLQEIAGLKLKCHHSNARALQVIEKLTRCMKGIIAEDQEPDKYVVIKQVEEVSQYTASPGFSSPVYSLPDEDKTELLTQFEINNDDEVIDLTQECNIVQERDNLIEKVKNALANMGLRNEIQMEISDDNYSQSILDNFQNYISNDDEANRQSDFFTGNITQNQPNSVINDITKATDIDPGIVLIENCSQSVQDINDTQMTKYSSASQDTELQIHQSTLLTQAVVIHEVNNTITKNAALAAPRSKNIFEDNVSNVIDISKETIPGSATPAVPETKTKKGRKKKNKENNAIPRNQTQTRGKNKPKKSNKGNKFNIVHGKGVIHAGLSVNKPHTTIYNKNVENDLSWVENLRYVREISPEENDITLSFLDDNFWNNFNLPDKWNDQDFEI